MNDKKSSRLRRAKSTRIKIRNLGANRLSVFKSSQHIYAQVSSASGDVILAAASTLDKNFENSATGNATAAQSVGKLIAERALAAGITRVAFDRSGYRFHGRIKALADAAREAGLEF